MDTEDQPDQPTIAGRALRALRTTKAPVVEDEIAPAAAPVDLTKSPVEETEPAAVAEPAGEQAEPEGAAAAASAPRTGNGPLWAAVGLVAAAAAYLIVATVIYFVGSTSSASKAANARDDAVVAARIDIATLQTLDYKNVRPGLQKWLNVTTGSFHDSIAQAIDAKASQIAAAKRVTVGKVVAVALTDLDAAHGTASAIATVDLTITPAGGKSALERNRYRATLKQDHGTWKIADLSLVQVGLS